MAPTAPEPLEAEAARRSFHTLDGLRGVAAMFIVCRHIGALFHGVGFSESFLAVDLFFVLSGYVIAHAYDARLARGGYAGRFFTLRLIRLYPLYIVGVVVGAAHLLSLMLRHGDVAWTPPKFAAAFVANALFLPSPVSGDDMYPMDGPCWTLLLELVANLLFAVFWRRLSDRVLAAVAAVAGVVMAVSAFGFGTLDIGWTRASFLPGFSRVFFSFCVGVLLCRRLPKRHRPSALAPLAAMAILGLVLAVDPGGPWRVAYELAAALVGFPLLIAWASGVEPDRAWAARLMAQMGIASYAIYVLHAPAADLFQSLSHTLLKIDWWRYAPASGFLYLALLLAITVPLDRVYDSPLRERLRKLTASKRRFTPAARPADI